MQISWLTLFYLILMPIVYKAITLNIIRKQDYRLRRYGEQSLTFYVLHILSFISYYAIELFMVYYHHSISGEWMIFKGQESSQELMFLFFICSVLFIIGHIYSILFESPTPYVDYTVPYHVLSLIVCFGLFMFLFEGSSNEGFSAVEQVNISSVEEANPTDQMYIDSDMISDFFNF